MQIELLYFEGCPNAEAFVPRLRELLAEADIDEPLRLRRVESAHDAERERFLGSPTLRINGRDVDPGADDHPDFGLTCRIYRTASGIAGTPPDEWVRRALAAPPRTGQAMADTRPGVAPAISASWAVQRTAGLTSAQRAVHRRILQTFAGGAVPTREQLATWTAPRDTDDVLAVLEAHDLVHRDPQRGAVAVAYPFSAAPTANRVRLATGVEIFAMCAIDALGIAFMLDAPTHVRSNDPLTGAPIEVTVQVSGDSEWSPADAVVVLACSDSGATSADCACPHTNFAACAEDGRRLLVDTVPGSCGSMLSMPDAITLGRHTFGTLLDPRGIPNIDRLGREIG